jgi:putative transposase
VKRGDPGYIKIDNGPEFIYKELVMWAYENQVTLDFSRPGKPAYNAYIESYIGNFRDECLNQNCFLEDTHKKVEAWRREYNETRPHGSLDNFAPREFAETVGLTGATPPSKKSLSVFYHFWGSGLTFL